MKFWLVVSEALPHLPHRNAPVQETRFLSVIAKVQIVACDNAIVNNNSY